MLIRYWMSKPVITVDKNDARQRAATLMKENRIRSLPVVDKGKLCGILSDRDLKRASAVKKILKLYSSNQVYKAFDQQQVEAFSKAINIQVGER